MVLRVAKLVVLAAFVMVVSAAAANRQASSLPPPGIQSNSGWFSVTTGPTHARQQEPPQLFAITAGSKADALTPLGVFRGLTKLDEKGALIWATTIGRVGHPF